MTMAARLLDTTVHGGTIVSGYPTVLIGGMPAARLGDAHLCPQVTVVVPHVGGPIALGAFTVLVGGAPLARATDSCLCVGPPDSILVGQPNVFVGLAGAPGAAGFVGLLCSLASAGLANVEKLLGNGYPRTALLPDGSTVTEYNSAITIRGSSEYQATVVSDLDRLAAPLPDGSTSTGARVIDGVQETGHHVTIRPVPPGGDQANASCNPARRSDDVAGVARAKPDGTAGQGADSIVEYNPSLTSEYVAEDGHTYTMEPHATLGHELVHGMHQGNGEDLIAVPDPLDPDDNREEARTIGVHGYEREEVSERRLHEEAGRGARPSHNAITRNTYQDENGQWHDDEQDSSGNWRRSTIPPPPGGGRPNH